MVRKIFYSKIFVLFLSMILVGFIIGYAYSVITAKNTGESHVDTVESLIQNAKDSTQDASEPE